MRILGIRGGKRFFFVELVRSLGESWACVRVGVVTGDGGV